MSSSGRLRSSGLKEFIRISNKWLLSIDLSFAIDFFVILTLLIVLLLILILHLLLKPFKLLLEMYVLYQLVLSTLILALVFRKLWFSRNSKLEYTLRLSFYVFGLFMLEARVTHECCLR